MAVIGNKTAEKDIREYLSQHGYFGNSAKFLELEIHSIGRPGWLQVFRFCVEAQSVSDQWQILFGAMKDDERFKINEIELYENRNRRDYQLKVWSEGLVKPKYSIAGAANFGLWCHLKEFAMLVAVVAALFGLLACLGVK